MSYGNASPLYQPVTRDIARRIAERLAPQTRAHIERMFTIMTRNCAVETLLFAAVARQLDLALRDQSSLLLLSAIRRDGKGKLQTENMKLLHDVKVEMHMAGGNMRLLQRELHGLGFELCMFHSCGDEIVPVDLVDRWYADNAQQQRIRTQLDWTGSCSIAPPVALLAHCHVTMRDLSFADDLAALAVDALGFGAQRAG